MTLSVRPDKSGHFFSRTMQQIGKNKHGARRTARVEIRLTPAEKTGLMEQADEAQAELSDFVRARIFGTTPRKHAQAKGERAELLRHLAGLGQISNSIRNVEISIKRTTTPDQVKIDEALKEIEKLGHYIRSLLHGH